MENASKALIIAGAILISILLISIGIILINSGRDITDTGTSGMNSQKIQTFNSQFTSYEGERKGSQLKDLANTVRSSNASDASHQVALYIDGATKADNSTAVTSLAGLVGSKTYNVTLDYADADTDAYPGGTTEIMEPATYTSEAGYVIAITISDVED